MFSIEANDAWSFFKQHTDMTFPVPGRPNMFPHLSDRGDSVAIVDEETELLTIDEDLFYGFLLHERKLEVEDARLLNAAIELVFGRGIKNKLRPGLSRKDVESAVRGTAIPPAGSIQAAFFRGMDFGDWARFDEIAKETPATTRSDLVAARWILAGDPKRALEERTKGPLNAPTLLWYYAKANWPQPRANVLWRAFGSEIRLTKWGLERRDAVIASTDMILAQAAKLAQNPIAEFFASSDAGTPARSAPYDPERDDRPAVDIAATDQTGGTPIGGLHEFRSTEEVPTEGWIAVNEDVNRLLVDIVNRLFRDGENRTREAEGVPAVGEGWLAEAQLLRSIRQAFPDEPVQHQASPKWLGRQRLDIFLPARNVAIEFNGPQHYEPIAFYGGEEGFEATKKRDATKRRLCKANSCLLIEVQAGYRLEDVIAKVQAVSPPARRSR